MKIKNQRLNQLQQSYKRQTEVKTEAIIKRTPFKRQRSKNRGNKITNNKTSKSPAWH